MPQPRSNITQKNCFQCTLSRLADHTLYTYVQHHCDCYSSRMLHRGDNTTMYTIVACIMLKTPEKQVNSHERFDTLQRCKNTKGNLKTKVYYESSNFFLCFTGQLFQIVLFKIICLEVLLVSNYIRLVFFKEKYILF